MSKRTRARAAAVADLFFESQRSQHPGITRTETDVMRLLQVPEVLLRLRSLKLWGSSFIEELQRRVAFGVPEFVAIQGMVTELERDIRPPRDRAWRRILRGNRP